LAVLASSRFDWWKLAVCDFSRIGVCEWSERSRDCIERSSRDDIEQSSPDDIERSSRDDIERSSHDDVGAIESFLFYFYLPYEEASFVFQYTIQQGSRTKTHYRGCTFPSMRFVCVRDCP
jgi:hypothetical protein